jgi:hypothetical protein
MVRIVKEQLVIVCRPMPPDSGNKFRRIPLMHNHDIGISKDRSKIESGILVERTSQLGKSLLELVYGGLSPFAKQVLPAPAVERFQNLELMSSAEQL